jgi:hypothetical protein
MTEVQQALLNRMDAMEEPQVRRVSPGVYLLMDGAEPIERAALNTVRSLVCQDKLEDVDNGQFVRPSDTWWR